MYEGQIDNVRPQERVLYESKSIYRGISIKSATQARCIRCLRTRKYATPSFVTGCGRFKSEAFIASKGFRGKPSRSFDDNVS